MPSLPLEPLPFTLPWDSCAAWAANGAGHIGAGELAGHVRLGIHEVRVHRKKQAGNSAAQFAGMSHFLHLVTYAYRIPLLLELADFFYSWTSNCHSTILRFCSCWPQSLRWDRPHDSTPSNPQGRIPYRQRDFLIAGDVRTFSIP